MDLRKLKTILELFENSDINELELSEGEEKLRLIKGAGRPDVAGPATQVLLDGASAPAPEPPAQPAPAPALAQEAASEPQGDAEAEGMVRLTSPMVGTFYARPSADEPPFVKVGDKVVEGDVVCIIEAMKLFNNVTAPASGTVAEVAVKNEQPVGYGDLLMVIDTN